MRPPRQINIHGNTKRCKCTNGSESLRGKKLLNKPNELLPEIRLKSDSRNRISHIELKCERHFNLLCS